MANKKRTKKIYPPLFRGSQHLKQWQKCYEEWLVSKHEHSGSQATVDTYCVEMRHFFTDPRRAPEHYTRDEIAAFIRRPVRVRGQITAPPSPYTRNRRLATIKSFYDFASAYHVGLYHSQRPLMNKPNPCANLRAVQQGRKPKGLSEDELKRLFAVIPRDTIADKRNYALFSAYFWSCRRRNEVLRLTWGDLYEVVFVEGGKQRVGHMYRYSSKGHSRDVFTAEFHQEAWEALLDYLKASGRYEHMQPCSPLFCATYYQPGGEKPLHVTTIRVIFQRYVANAGIANGRKITPHWLRHTRAQLQRKYDKSPDALEKLRKLLGHQSIATTMIYLSDIEEKPDDGAALLASLIGPL